ncbi:MULTISPECIES: GAF domain-containing sensor histidine kinase [unclassified Fusibacter]|uniref:GAF domain-containing sensor histidine kinase n=1 Tax=unclassified Fusibacter TaxID=2624464 RepID=UPI0013E98A62|nr:MULTISPECIES: GAF domain-containing sensor histidine kinase [unclassified Fusibacter]MCK8061503.1 GAF domain-containing sensor histidine kinase [Fusibacter sp. A2]NPE23688.1 GAF domain-containing sensor histidine kinase [Fusibacter sp. A1]
MESVVKIRKENTYKTVSISETLSEVLDDSIVAKWQNVLDLAADLFNVPSALIMKLHSNEIEVFVKSANDGNPYEEHEKAPLGIGLYCETVIGTDSMLQVPDALDDPVWAENPDVKLKMINYLGLPIKWPNGDVFGTICVLDDHRRNYDNTLVQLIHTLKDTVEKDLNLVNDYFNLQKMMDLLERSQKLIGDHQKNQVISELVSNISHEISTPIGLAYTAATLMRKIATDPAGDKASESEILEGSELIMKHLEQASELVKAFQTIATDIVVGKIEHVDMGDYISSIIMSMKYDLRKNGVSVSLRCQEGVKVAVNSAALTQIIINLVVNAMKHAFSGLSDKEIDIEVGSTDSQVLITVSDNGCGISESGLDDIFKPFVKLNPSLDGSGMGLSIVKEIVENKLMGSIECHSEVGKGTIFNVVLPKETSDE